MLTLQNKIILITGAAQGIGRATALKLASHGAKLVLNDINETKLNIVHDEIKTIGGTVVCHAGDITEKDFAQKFLDTALTYYNDVHIIINNAGIISPRPVHLVDDTELELILDINLQAPFKIIRQAKTIFTELFDKEYENDQVPTVRKIINITSISGLFGEPGHIHYSATKAGLDGITRAAAKEFAVINTTVNSVAMGLIETEMMNVINAYPKLKEKLLSTIPLNRPGTIDEAAGSIYLLCLNESNYITGHTLSCTGGVNYSLMMI
jgi:3-oxoacyl-[acyl-carrier protein] reductase